MRRGSRIDELMTLLFMLLFIASVICFFAVDNRLAFIICGGVAFLLRVIQYIMRIFP
jgi:Ca2+/Na+ antiporter